MTTDRRFGGVERLFGVQGARIIRDAHIVVVGIGGVGSWAAESLARSGVGKLTLIDLDHVAESNVNRQIHATEASIGQAKVLAMRDRIHGFFPQCEITCIEEFVSQENWRTLVPDTASAVIDACDQVLVKTSLAAWALQTGTTYVTSGAAGGKRLAHLASIEDIARVTHDPLLSKVRYLLRKHFDAPRNGSKIGISCVFSSEEVALPDESCHVVSDGSLNCQGFGSLVTVTSTFGQCAAGFVLNNLASQPLELTKKCL